MNLFIPVICYNHTCHTSYMFSLMKLVLALKDLKVSVTLFPIVFDSLVNRARNAAVAYFLTGNYTHLLFIDSDIEFQTEDIIKMIVAKKEVIGGAYAQKWLNLDKIKIVFKNDVIPENPMHLCTNHSVHLDTTNTNSELVEVEYLTTGCMLIERQVIEKMIEKYPERKYMNDIDGYQGANQNMFYNLFSVEINPLTKRYESEDYGFCRLWKQMGGKIYIIPDMTLLHYGWYGYGVNVKKQLEYNNTKE